MQMLPRPLFVVTQFGAVTTATEKGQVIPAEVVDASFFAMVLMILYGTGSDEELLPDDAHDSVCVSVQTRTSLRLVNTFSRSLCSAFQRL